MHLEGDKEETFSELVSAEERVRVAVGIESSVQRAAADSGHGVVPATVADAVKTPWKIVVSILDAADGVGGLEAMVSAKLCMAGAWGFLVGLPSTVALLFSRFVGARRSVSRRQEW